MLTKRPKQILDFIAQYQKNKGYAPSLEKICKKFKLASVSTAHFHISNLKKAGYLENKARTISILEKEPLIKIPLLGTIAAGEPIEAVRENEFIAVAKSKLPKNGDFYALRVSGNSMIDENIKDGDVVLVKQQETAENGQRVVALIDNYEATLKKFYRERHQIRLQPANSAYEPIIIRMDRDIKIQGIVIDVIQNEPDLQAQNFLTTVSLKRNKILPLNKIILGDALVELKKLPDESCDVVVCDPPYNIGKDFGNNHDRRETTEYVSWCKEWINECIRTMKTTGTMFIYGFSEILAYLSVEIPINKRWLIWHYTNKNVASLNFWQRSHEAIICAWKDKPVFNKDEVREPYTEGFLNGAAGKIRKGTLGRYGKDGKETVYNAHEGGALPRDVIKIPALAGGAGMIERWFLCKTCDNVYKPRELKNHLKHEIMKHPTQKPFELSRKLIKSAMPQNNGVVLVPFVGTGSECAAAKELGQSYIGFEINPDYVRIAEKWLVNTNTSIDVIPIGLEKIKKCNAELEKRFQNKLIVNNDLKRTLVSFQANKKTPGYRWYKFKEGYSSALVEYVLDKLDITSGKVIDPFAGSGTSLFVSAERGLDTLGIELLPICAEIIGVRKIILKNKDHNKLINFLQSWVDEKPWLKENNGRKINHLKITVGAFPKETEELIGKFLNATEKEGDRNYGRILRFALFCVLEEISFTRKDGQCLRWDYRSGRSFGKNNFSKGEIKGFNQSITEKLKDILSDIEGNNTLFDFTEKQKREMGNIKILRGSCLSILPTLKSNNFDFLITSPPYCNRYDYTRTYALELAILDVDEQKIRKLRQAMMSCTVENRNKENLNSLFTQKIFDAATKAFDEQKELQEIIKYLEVKKNDRELNNPGIVRMVKNYFYEMSLVIFESARLLKSGSPFVMVNDNVRYAGANIPVDLILSDIAQSAGFNIEKIWVLPIGKGNSSQQMGTHGREELRKCVYVWKKL